LTLRALRDLFDTRIPVTWALLGLAVFLALLWGWFSAGLVMKLTRFPIQVLPGAFGRPFQDVEIPTEDGVALKGWFVPAPAPSDATIVLSHGWGANRSDILPHTVFLSTAGGYNLLYFDFRNHGESGGDRSSLTVLEQRDLRGALKWLWAEKPEQSRRTALYGLSMGGAASLSVAADDPRVAAVCAESPFSSFRDVVARFAKLFYGVPRHPFVDCTFLFIRWRLGFDPEPASPVYSIRRISPRPVFLIQGAADVRMPPSEGERLYAAAAEPKALWTVPEADHGQAAEVAGAEYRRRLLEFYRAALAAPARGS
jgi:pimeloyl-ACP methyl ester carboxylesterase